MESKTHNVGRSLPATASTPDQLVTVLTSRTFWLGVLVIFFGLIALGLLMNYAVMPLYTRHDAAVEVPDLAYMNPDEARGVLSRRGLDAQMRDRPFNPLDSADVVVEQTPEAHTIVKPGRRVYFYVNASPEGVVEVPDVRTKSEGQARPELLEAGLEIGEIRIDSVRTPNEGTVTRQEPAPGRQVTKRTPVNLWVSPGTGSREVRVPDVVGLSPEEAKERLERAGIYVTLLRVEGNRILCQDPAAGATVHEGDEVILRSTPC